MRAAKAWGLTPRSWRDHTADDRALMLAFVLFEGMRDTRREEYREELAELRKRKAHGGDQFDKMKERLWGHK